MSISTGIGERTSSKGSSSPSGQLPTNNERSREDERRSASHLTFCRVSFRNADDQVWMPSSIRQGIEWRRFFVVNPTLASSIQMVTSAPATAQVLLVEDDDELREGLAENLRLNGLTVREAATGSDFRVAMATSEVDVAIIDVNLPDANGFELARDLRDDENRPGIIMLTARADRQDRLQGFAEGADLYMTKPVDSDELVLAIRNLAKRIIQSRAHRPRPAVEGLTWRLDVARKILMSPDNKFLILTGKEVMLLEMFEKARGKAISREYAGAAMGYGVPGPNHRGLDAALRRLKEKAEKMKIDLPFLIVHSVGIRFVGELKNVF